MDTHKQEANDVVEDGTAQKVSPGDQETAFSEGRNILRKYVVTEKSTYYDDYEYFAYNERDALERHEEALNSEDFSTPVHGPDNIEKTVRLAEEDTQEATP